MKLYLTSSPTGPLDGSRKVNGIDEMNGLRARLTSDWPKNARCLIITASPDAYSQNDEMVSFFREAFVSSGLPCLMFDLWDGRTVYRNLNQYDVILLGGGHVPTQNAWFSAIRLHDTIKDFNGIIIGISAGTMNCADTVYAQPEEPGEGSDPNYRRYLKGLALTHTQILPHYQMTRDYILDGMRLFEDITYHDSYNHRFLALTDGAFLYCENGHETVFGQSYLISDGMLTPFCTTGQSREWNQPDA